MGEKTFDEREADEGDRDESTGDTDDWFDSSLLEGEWWLIINYYGERLDWKVVVGKVFL